MWNITIPLPPHQIVPGTILYLKKKKREAQFLLFFKYRPKEPKFAKKQAEIFILNVYE